MAITRDNHFVPRWYPKLFAEMFAYLRSVTLRGPKPNFEEGLAARFVHAHASAQKALERRREPGNKGNVSCVFAPGGIHDNGVNRLLLMSSLDHHMPMVPMAFYIRRPDSER